MTKRHAPLDGEVVEALLRQIRKCIMKGRRVSIISGSVREAHGDVRGYANLADCGYHSLVLLQYIQKEIEQLPKLDGYEESKAHILAAQEHIAAAFGLTKIELPGETKH